MPEPSFSSPGFVLESTTISGVVVTPSAIQSIARQWVAPIVKTAHVLHRLCRRRPFRPLFPPRTRETGPKATRNPSRTALPCAELLDPGSHPAGATGDALPAVGPEAGGAASPTVPRSTRPPADPRAQRPATAAPEPRALSGRSHHDLRLAQRAVTPPSNARPRTARPFRPKLLDGFPQRLAQVGIGLLPAAGGRHMHAGNGCCRSEPPAAAPAIQRTSISLCLVDHRISCRKGRGKPCRAESRRRPVLSPDHARVAKWESLTGWSRSGSAFGAPDQRQHGPPDRLRQVRPRLDDAGQVGVGGGRFRAGFGAGAVQARHIVAGSRCGFRW
jgi:hypothetical protein